MPKNHPSSIREFFELGNRKRKYPKNTIIVMQDGSIDEVFFIEEGFIRVLDYDSRGEQRTVTLVTKNHIFPFVWLQYDLPKTGALYYYQAITDVECYTANTDALRGFVRSNPEITWRLLDILSKSYYNISARTENLQKSNVAEKVDFILYYLAQSFGKIKKDNDEISAIDALISHKEIADLAGLTRETVSRQMKKPKYREIYWKKDKSTYIDVSKLDVETMPKVFSVAV